MLRLPLVLAAALTLVACDSQESDPPRLGQFEGTVRGDLHRDLEGNAAFTTFVGFGNERVLTLNLAPPPTSAGRGRFASLSDYEGQVDGPGTYALGGSRLEAPSLLYFDEGTSLGGVWTSTGGTLRVTRFEEDRIDGALNVTLERADPETGETAGRAVLEADFEAVALDAPR